jgi:hypothetical protein
MVCLLTPNFNATAVNWPFGLPIGFNRLICTTWSSVSFADGQLSP